MFQKMHCAELDLCVNGGKIPASGSLFFCKFKVWKCCLFLFIKMIHFQSQNLGTVVWHLPIKMLRLMFANNEVHYQLVLFLLHGNRSHGSTLVIQPDDQNEFPFECVTLQIPDLQSHYYADLHFVFTARIRRMGKVIFSVCVSVHTSTGRGRTPSTDGEYPLPRSRQGGRGYRFPRSRREGKRYASCVHARGLSCYNLFRQNCWSEITMETRWTTFTAKLVAKLLFLLQ